MSARACQAGHDRALYPRRHQDDPRHHEPAGADGVQAQGDPAARLDLRRLARPALEVADIFRDHGSAWRKANAGHVQPRPAESDVCDRDLPHRSSRRPCRALRGLRLTTIAYNSCRNRHCPKCQGAAAKEWLAAREADLLPVPYYHVVFTLPAPIADIAYQNKAVIYDLLFKVSAETHADDRCRSEAFGCQDRYHLGPAQLGFGHDPSPACPHDRAGRRHLARRQALGGVPAQLLPSVRVLSRLFRRLFLEKLIAAHKAGHLDEKSATIWMIIWCRGGRNDYGKRWRAQGEV